MPYRKEQFINGEIYHVVLRALDDNLIFKDVNDYYRGIFSIYEFNNLKPTTIQNRRKERARFKKLSSPDRDRVSIVADFVDKRDKLVDILAFCFMPNHIHLLLRQLKENGITQFMRKVGIGYAGYFNRRHSRKGYVFQNRFKDVHIENDDQLKTVFTYIHTNPISLIEPGWKKVGIKDPEKIEKFLNNYKWFSYSDYIGNNNFPSVTERNFILEIMGGKQGCKDFVDNWIRYKKMIGEFPEILLE